MSYRQPIIEFLAEPENMGFLLDIEPLIPKVKEYKYFKSFEDFQRNYLIPEIWPKYSYELKDNTFILETEKFKGDDFFKIHVHVGEKDKNNWYGIYGGEIFNRPNLEFQKLKDILENQGVNKRDKWVPAFQYFSRNRMELLTLPNEALDDFLMEWSEIFWNFANNVKSAVEASNEIILQNMT